MRFISVLHCENCTELSVCEAPFKLGCFCHFLCLLLFFPFSFRLAWFCVGCLSVRLGPGFFQYWFKSHSISSCIAVFVVTSMVLFTVDTPRVFICWVVSICMFL